MIKRLRPTKLFYPISISFHYIIAIVFFFMILILLYRFDTVNSFLALYFIISNLIIVLFLIKFNYLYVKFLISKK